MSAASVWMLAAAVAANGAAGRFAGRLVSRVELTAEAGTVPEAAEELLEIGPGDPFQPSAVRRSIKQLFALGSFSDIKVEAEPEGDAVALLFRLYPAVVVEHVEILGLEEGPAPLERAAEELLKNPTLQRGAPFDAAAVERVSAQMKEAFAGEGFYEGSVEPEVRFQGPEAFLRFHVQLGTQARLRELRIQGAPSEVERDIEQGLSLDAGRRYSRRALDADIERLVNQWRSEGYYEAAVQVQETRRDGVAVELDLTVNLGPRVLVRVGGADLRQENLSRLIPILREQSVSSDLVEESRGSLEEHFREKGYRDAAVTVERSEPGGGRYLLYQFHVQPGQKYRVGDVRIEGLHRLAPNQVLSVMKTRPKRFFDSPFRPQVWEEDLDEVERHLRRQGFHRVSVEGEVHERDGSSGTLDAVLRVEEGPRAFIEVIDVEGAEGVASTEVLAASGLDVGTPFYPPEIAEARERILQLYRDRGYREAGLEVQTGLDDTETQASVTLQIREGEQTFVGRVILSGLEVTRERAIRRDITVLSHAPLSTRELLETRQRLIGTGLFRNVELDVLDENPSDRSSDVLIRFEEGPRTSFGYGFGYNERELARVEGEVTRRNLFGLNRTVSIFGRASIRGGRFITTYRQPQFLGYRLPVFFSAFYEEEYRSSFDYIRKGVGFQISQRLSDDQNLFFRYSYDRSDVTRLDVPMEELPREFRDIKLSTVSASLVTDTRDDPLTPSRGQFRLLDIEVSARFLGSQSPYLKGLAQQFFYFPLPRRMVGVIGLRFGIGQTFRRDLDAKLPITERFFAGGANTLRGFGLDQASPKDPSGNPVGGNVLALLNLELRFPLFGKLGGVLFSDNGSVYRRLQVIELLNWRYNLGFGLRYDTPLGPLRVDWGFKIDIRPGEPPSRVHVSLGHAF